MFDYDVGVNQFNFTSEMLFYVPWLNCKGTLLQFLDHHHHHHHFLPKQTESLRQDASHHLHILWPISFWKPGMKKINMGFVALNDNCSVTVIHNKTTETRSHSEPAFFKEITCHNKCFSHYHSFILYRFSHHFLYSFSSSKIPFSIPYAWLVAEFFSVGYGLWGGC